MIGKQVDALWRGMPALPAMLAIVHSSESTIRSLSNMAGLPEALALLFGGPHPVPGLLFILGERPRQILDLDQLPHQRRARVPIVLAE